MHFDALDANPAGEPIRFTGPARLIQRELPLTIIGDRLTEFLGGVDAMELQTSPVEVKVEPGPRKRPRWRLRILIAFSVLAVALFAISRLEPDQARRCGPVIESVYRVFNPPVEFELTDAGSQFIAEITAMGGTAHRIEPRRRFLGLLGADETFVVSFSVATFDDAALARLATTHGDRIEALHLMDTGVTDDGIRHLKRFGNLTYLNLASNAPRWVNGKRLTPITDAGLAHLDLRKLGDLNLSGLPITDAGLTSLPDLPALHNLQMADTQVKGPGLGRLVAFRQLSRLHLNGSAVTDDGLGHLAAASSLVVLSLDGTFVTAAGLKHVAALPQLRELSIRGCQVPDADVADIKADARSRSLRIVR